jgi:hypothetical protein
MVLMQYVNQNNQKQVIECRMIINVIFRYQKQIDMLLIIIVEYLAMNQ